MLVKLYSIIAKTSQKKNQHMFNSFIKIVIIKNILPISIKNFGSQETYISHNNSQIVV